MDAFKRSYLTVKKMIPCNWVWLQEVKIHERKEEVATVAETEEKKEDKKGEEKSEAKEEAGKKDSEKQKEPEWVPMFVSAPFYTLPSQILVT